MHIRPLRDDDADAVWEIFHTVVAARDTYAFPPDTPREEGEGYWYGPDITAFAAERAGRVIGIYKLIVNRRGLGAHVANASFMVHPHAAGRGVGHALGVHCLHEARRQGYDAMQFNFVVSTNERGVALWKRLGFTIVGTLPRAFRHGTLGLVDAYVMHRDLDDIVPTFGTPPPAGDASVRPSAYAVIANASGEIAVVDAEEATMLPGGGCDAGEDPIDAARREAEEECALRLGPVEVLGDAVQFVYSRKHATHFEKRSRFVAAHAVTPAARTAQHPTRWLALPAAIAAVGYDSHAWALTRWARRNT